MRVLIASDLHFEFHADSGAALLASLPEADVFVCPGDLTIAAGLGDALGKLLERYAHVVFVAGNHEFYRSSLAKVRQALRRVAECVTGFHYLEQSECTIEGRRFLGATLWFPQQRGSEILQPLASDFRLISDAVPGIYEEHERAVRYLDATVDQDTIVVTHHLPHPRSLPPSLVSSPLNRFLLSDLGQLIADKQPALWVHGHAHTSSDYQIGRTRAVCNPFGYAGRSENPHFRRDCLIDL